MVKGEPPPRCHFCGTKNVMLVNIGIALNMGGADYSFCEDCLKNNSAYKFWFNFFDTLGLEFPGDDDPEEEPEEA
jgi:hypothetical protein